MMVWGWKLFESHGKHGMASLMIAYYLQEMDIFVYVVIVAVNPIIFV